MFLGLVTVLRLDSLSRKSNILVGVGSGLCYCCLGRRVLFRSSRALFITWDSARFLKTLKNRKKGRFVNSHSVP